MSNVIDFFEKQYEESIQQAINEDIAFLNYAVEHTVGPEYVPLVEWFRKAEPNWGNIVKTRATARTALILYLCSDLETGLVNFTSPEIMEMWYAFKSVYGGEYISEKTLYNQTIKVRNVYKPYVICVSVPMNTRTYTKTCFNLRLMQEEVNHSCIGQQFNMQNPTTRGTNPCN